MELAPAPSLLVRRWPERRAVVLGAAALLMAGVFVATRAAGDALLGLALLSAIPVTLVALELGLVGGLAAAAAAIALLEANVAGGHLDLGAVGIATRSLVFVAVGGIAGWFSDRMRAAYERERRLLESGLALGTATTLDELPGAIARAARRIPGAAGAVVEVAGAPTAHTGSDRGARTAVPISTRGAALGRIELVRDAGLAPEDRAALELLARQAALAADNHRLLEREREAAAAEAELRRVRADLLEQRSGLGHLLDAQEEERRRVAERLHEDLAQVLAAVLLGLRALRRRSSDDGGVPLDELHAQVVSVLGDVRAAATSLRPSALAELGLLPALESLAESARRDRGCEIAIAHGAVPEPLPEPLRTGVYRMVEEAVAACRSGGRTSISLNVRGGALEIELALPSDEPEITIAAARARATLLDGSLALAPGADGHTTMRVSLPLERPAA